MEKEAAALLTKIILSRYQMLAAQCNKIEVIGFKVSLRGKEKHFSLASFSRHPPSTNPATPAGFQNASKEKTRTQFSEFPFTNAMNISQLKRKVQ